MVKTETVDGLEKLENSLYKPYVLENDFEQYHPNLPSVERNETLIRLQLQLPPRVHGNNDQNTICKVNAMFNLASLRIDRSYQQHSNRYQYLIEQGCKYLIKGLNGIIFHTLENQWVGDF